MRNEGIEIVGKGIFKERKSIFEKLMVSHFNTVMLTEDYFDLHRGKFIELYTSDTSTS